MTPINPEFQVPFTFDFAAGSVVEVEQGDDNEIQQRVWTALSYQPGQLLYDATIGIEDQAFRLGGADLNLIERIVQKWVPDANEVITRDPNWFQTLVDTVTIRRDNSQNV